MGETQPALAWENRLALAVVQALLGFVSPVLRGVAIEIDGDEVIIHFAVASLDSETSDDIDDMVGDVEGLMWPDQVTVKSKIREGVADASWEGRQHRLVLLAKA